VTTSTQSKAKGQLKEIEFTFKVKMKPRLTSRPYSVRALESSVRRALREDYDDRDLKSVKVVDVIENY